MSEPIEKPLVSIIIPVYNKEKYLGATLGSVLGQTYRNFEVIAIDDGSTDGSLGLIQKIASTDHRFRWISQQNGGISATRNRGLREARGAFVNMLDADDLLYPEFVERTVGHLERNPSVDIVHTSWDRIDERGRFLEKYIAPDSADYLRDLLVTDLFAPSAMMFRKSLFDRVGPFLNIKTGDWEYFTRIAKMGGRFGRIPMVLVAYREAANSDKKIIKDQGRRFFEAIEVIFNGEMPPQYKALKDISLIRHHLVLTVEHREWGLKRSSKEHFAIALALISEKGGIDNCYNGYFVYFLAYFTLLETVRFCIAFSDKGMSRRALEMWGRRILGTRLMKILRPTVKGLLKIGRLGMRDRLK